MEDLISIILSVLALSTSFITTYLTFFHESNELTVAMDRAPLQVQSGSSSNGEKRTKSFHFFVKPSFILALQGTRPLVLADIQLVRARNRESILPTETKAFRLGGNFESLILEKGSLKRLTLEFSLEDSDLTSEDNFAVEDRFERWCLQFTIYDHKGRRAEPIIHAFDLDVVFSPPADEEDYPNCSLELDVPKGPRTIVSRKSFRTS